MVVELLAAVELAEHILIHLHRVDLVVAETLAQDL
jgi:hypothetical protein